MMITGSSTFYKNTKRSSLPVTEKEVSLGCDTFPWVVSATMSALKFPRHSSTCGNF